MTSLSGPRRSSGPLAFPVHGEGGPSADPGEGRGKSRWWKGRLQAPRPVSPPPPFPCGEWSPSPALRGRQGSGRLGDRLGAAEAFAPLGDLDVLDLPEEHFGRLHRAAGREDLQDRRAVEVWPTPGEAF